MLEYFAFILFMLFVIAGFLAVFMGLAGPFLVVIGAVLFDFITWSQIIPLWSIVILAVLAIAGEGIEAVMLYRAGTRLSSYGQKGLIEGAILGSKLFSKFRFGGLLTGGLLGTFLGEWAGGKSASGAWKSAKGLLVRKAFAGALKLVIILVQVLVVVRSI